MNLPKFMIFFSINFHKKYHFLKVILLLLLIPINVLASSKVEFPNDWETWVEVKTTLASLGQIPNCAADLPEIPNIYEEAIVTYCAVRLEGPGEVKVLVNPDVLPAYEAKLGRFNDGPNMALFFPQMKVLLITGHQNQQIRYGAYTTSGKDIATNIPEHPMNPETCINCHTGYQAFCQAGQCGTKTKN